MIEVEKKFILSEQDIASLVEDAIFLGEKKLRDRYFDTAEFTLSKSDMWLRERDGQWDLKIPLHQDGGKFSQQYYEVIGEVNIRQVFGVPALKDFETDIAAFGYNCFCDIQTKRKKYRKENFTIDLDEVSAQDFQYCVAEIELMVSEKNETVQALEKIEKFAAQHQLKSEYVRGKVRQYIKQKRPQHFEALLEAGIENKF